MKRFKEFLAEAFLIEGKIDDLKAQNPGLHREIDQYAAADTSVTKKFLPWLVSQHKKGIVSPDHPDLHQTIQNFDRYKNLHGIKDHSSRSFQEVRDAVMPLVGGGATKAEIAHEGREKIHDSGDVQAYHIKTKEASQKFYGGGPKAGPTNTTWCVSARSGRCRYGEYGPMYVIHANDDPNSPYAVHPEVNKITNRHNDADRDIDQEMNRLPAIAKLKPAINVIRKHHDAFTFRLANDSDLTQKEINMGMYDKKIQKHLLRNPHQHIALAALNHPNADEETVFYAARHPDPHVALAALNHAKADVSTTWSAAENTNPQVALAALKHLKADTSTTWSAAENTNPQVALAALKHRKADVATVAKAINHQDPHVVLAALKHRKATHVQFWDATTHPDQRVQALARTKLGK